MTVRKRNSVGDADNAVKVADNAVEVADGRGEFLNFDKTNAKSMLFISHPLLQVLR